jgi:hypothetical protein
MEIVVINLQVDGEVVALRQRFYFAGAEDKK